MSCVVYATFAYRVKTFTQFPQFSVSGVVTQTEIVVGIVALEDPVAVVAVFFVESRYFM